jgi:hypothetical protein
MVRREIRCVISCAYLEHGLVRDQLRCRVADCCVATRARDVGEIVVDNETLEIATGSYKAIVVVLPIRKDGCRAHYKEEDDQWKSFFQFFITP